VHTDVWLLLCQQQCAHRSLTVNMSATMCTQTSDLHWRQHCAHRRLNATLSATLCTQSSMNPARGVSSSTESRGMCGALPPHPLFAFDTVQYFVSYFMALPINLTSHFKEYRWVAGRGTVQFGMLVPTLCSNQRHSDVLNLNALKTPIKFLTS
jgi:hypothetical protein